MDIQNPCLKHDNYQVSSVCLDKDCKLQRLFCDVCLAQHNMHHVVPFKQFQLKFSQFQVLVEDVNSRIKKEFIKIKQTFSICIKRTEERVIKQLVSFSHLPKLAETQIQQRYGIITDAINNKKFSDILKRNIRIQDEKSLQMKMLQEISICLQQMNTSLMASINKFMSQLKLNIVNKNQIANQSINESMMLPPTFFKFSEKFKPKQFQLSENGKCVTRGNSNSQGLTMYCVCQQPLSRQNNTICFTITEQPSRFIYFGVCDNQTFRAFSFKGNLYQKGNKMYGIRQSSKQKANAVCLHNSLQQYSNKEKVPWDFTVGDVIALKYDESKNSILFEKNGKQKFQMPLDHAIKKFYPFVGLKFTKDSVRILSQDLKKKNFLSSFF